MIQSRKMNRKPNSNRGGALLSVIIVMAIVGILGALVMSMAYTNFKMKVVDRKSKNNFYSAEKVLEEVCTGLEVEASKQYESAYEYVMSRYNGKESTIEGMEKDFNTMFVVKMVDVVKNGTDSEHYNITTLKSYVKDMTESVDGKSGFTVGTTDLTANTNVIETLADGLCLRNVNVTYKDGDYFNTITTDIKITTPQVGFAMISTMPEIADYSFIAEGGISVLSGNTKVNGKSYAGLGLTQPNANEVSISIASGTTFDVTGAKATLVVSKGEIMLNGNSTFTTGSGTSLWAESLTAGSNGNKLSLQGRTYIKDDTTLDGASNSLVLSGQYYGYGNDGDINADGNSAIIINGHQSVLDMSNLNSLVLAGTSFVSTKQETYDQLKDENGQALPSGLNTDDILMGDSVAIKTNQLIYLVPTECEGITTNPMTYAQYKSLISTTDWEARILKSQLRNTRRTLASYGQDKVGVTPVFTNRNGGVVYLYLDFADAAVASEYFMDYYLQNKDQMHSYLNNYLANIKINDSMSRIVTRGNYLVPLPENKVGYSGSTGDVVLSAQEQTNYESSFEALCTKLITNKAALVQSDQADKNEIGKTVYENLIDDQKITEFVNNVKNAVSVTGATYNATSNSVVMSTGEDSYVIVVDNKSGVPFSLNSSYENKKGIILATGDVNMTSTTLSSWEGLVICGGKLTIQQGTKTMTANSDVVGKAMMASCELTITNAANGTSTTKNYTVVNFFKSGKNYTLGADEENNSKNDIRNNITFENYKSE